MNVRIYDAGETFADRYTVLPPRAAWRRYKETNGLWMALGCGANPFHPQGFGQWTHAAAGGHLGKRIAWDALPSEAQQFVREQFSEFI